PLRPGGDGDRAVRRLPEALPQAFGPCRDGDGAIARRHRRPDADGLAQLVRAMADRERAAAGAHRGAVHARAAADRDPEGGSQMIAARTPIALTIAGSDSSGGAGIQADLKTFSAFGVYGASAITALTAQNTRGVTGVEPVAASFVVAQIEAVLADLDVGAIKTGMLANAGIVEAVARCLRAAQRRPLVVDPVMVATSGDLLLEADAVETMKRHLIPLASLITPNLHEAAWLLGTKPAGDDAQAIEHAKALHALGCGAVLLKGGHGAGETAVDILCDGE